MKSSKKIDALREQNSKLRAKVADLERNKPEVSEYYEEEEEKGFDPCLLLKDECDA